MENNSYVLIVLMMLITNLRVLKASELDGAIINFKLNNNPKCSTQLENIAKDQKWNYVNTPSITITGAGFNNGEKMITLIFKDKVITKKHINIAEHNFETCIDLPAPLENPREIEVTIGDDFRRIIPVELRRLYGIVTHYDGTPVPYPIITAGDVVAVGDEQGNYEIHLDGAVYPNPLGIFEKSYTKETLECWLTGLVVLVKDTKLDVKIDKCEVYELGAWPAYTGVYIHFIPMSLTRTHEAMKQGATNEMEISSNPDTWPHLIKDDVKVFIDENEVHVSSFNEYDDFIGEYNGKKITRPGYILGVAKNDFKTGIIKVEIQHRIKTGNNEIVEKGEGYFFGFAK